MRTKSSRTSVDFEDDKKASLDFIRTLKEEYKIEDQLAIRQYYIDSKHRDDDSLYEKENILDVICKMDPIFMGVEILKIEEIIIYDSLNNRYEIKEEITTKYTDYDGKSHVTKEIKSETQDFNIIKGVEVERVDTNEYKGFWCCKS